jgi:Zn-dependent protease with chaperone function
MKRDSVDDYYVKGEKRQCILLYLMVALLVAFVIVLAFAAFNYLKTSPIVNLITSAVYFILSIAIGAIAGLFIFNAFSRFKYIRIMLRNSLKTSSKNFPGVFDAIKVAAERLSMEPVESYVTQNPAVNAFMVKPALLRGRKIIVLNTGLLSTVEGNELLFIVGHELSHIKYGRWRSIGSFSLPYILSPQYTEYRCDRGGLVACGDAKASVRALLKLVTGKEFIDRVDVRSFEREDKSVSTKMLLKLASHPMIDSRIRELLRFSESLK